MSKNHQPNRPIKKQAPTFRVSIREQIAFKEKQRSKQTKTKKNTDFSS